MAGRGMVLLESRDAAHAWLLVRGARRLVVDSRNVAARQENDRLQSANRREDGADRQGSSFDNAAGGVAVPVVGTGTDFTCTTASNKSCGAQAS